MAKGPYGSAGDDGSHAGITFALVGRLFLTTVRDAQTKKASALMRSLAMFGQQADHPNSNHQEADTHQSADVDDGPDSASAKYPERNKIGSIVPLVPLWQQIVGRCSCRNY
jgi:hypothetical protein